MSTGLRDRDERQDEDEAIEAAGVRALDRDDLLKIVSLWDPTKQQIAVSSMQYCFEHVEKNKGLVVRLAAFLEKAGEGGTSTKEEVGG